MCTSDNIKTGTSAKNMDRRVLQETLQSLDSQNNNGSTSIDNSATRSTDSTGKEHLSNSHRYVNVISNEEIKRNLQYSVEVLSEDQSHHTRRVDQLQKEIEDHMKWKNENQAGLDTLVER